MSHDSAGYPAPPVPSVHVTYFITDTAHGQIYYLGIIPWASDNVRHVPFGNANPVLSHPPAARPAAA